MDLKAVEGEVFYLPLIASLEHEAANDENRPDARLLMATAAKVIRDLS